MKHDFFAIISRMKLIERWSLMRNSRPENVSEHSLEVSIIAHALAIISNEEFGNNLNVERVVLMAIYHDSTEIITGDLPTPIKYYNLDIREAFQTIEEMAANKLLNMLPDYMKEYYEDILIPNEDEEHLWKLVKAADKLSALIKCIEERKAGNTEFERAEESIRVIIDEMELKEIDIFVRDFLPAYEKTLDELNI